MTKRQFIIANFFKKIGFTRSQKRLHDAATELQLLKDAEEILGRNIWTKIKDLENYKDNYWGINKLIQERSDFSDKIQEIKDKIENIKQNQETKFIEDNSSEQNIDEMYEKQKLVVDKIKSEQADISNVAANIKKSFDRAVASLKLITTNGNEAAEVNAEKTKIEQLKNKFSDLKDKKAFSDKKLAKQTAILMKISDALQNTKSSYKENAIGNYEIMGKANQALSIYRSKIGLLDNQIIAHYNDIGQNISKEYYSDNECRKAVKGKSNLCKIIKSLRQSIDFNHTLADR